MAFVRSCRARRLAISVRPFAGVRVTVPGRMSRLDAAARLVAQTAWVRRQLAAGREREAWLRRQLQHCELITAAEARCRLVTRLEVLASACGYCYNRVTIRQQKTRWGSCSAANNISLNQTLVYLPAELQDYVLLHELVHLEIKNHSSHFWRRLSRHLPDFADRRRRLRQYDFFAGLDPRVLARGEGRPPA